MPKTAAKWKKLDRERMSPAPCPSPAQTDSASAVKLSRELYWKMGARGIFKTKHETFLAAKVSAIKSWNIQHSSNISKNYQSTAIPANMGAKIIRSIRLFLFVTNTPRDSLFKAECPPPVDRQILPSLRAPLPTHPIPGHLSAVSMILRRSLWSLPWCPTCNQLLVATVTRLLFTDKYPSLRPPDFTEHWQLLPASLHSSYTFIH